MGQPHFLRSDAIGDVMLLELRDVVSSLPDHTFVSELEIIRQLRREMGCTKVIFDLGQAQFFGSALLEMIRVLWNDISDLGGTLVLCNPSEFGREVLAIAKFDQLWPLVESREQAMEMVGPAKNVANWPVPLQQLITQYENGPQTASRFDRWGCHRCNSESRAARRVERIAYRLPHCRL